MPNNPNGKERSSSVIRPTKKEQFRKSFRQRAASSPTWDTVQPELVHALVCITATHNAPLTMSYTRDGTALVVACYHNGERHVDYLSGQDEVAQYFEWLMRDLLELDKEEIAYAAQMQFREP